MASGGVTWVSKDLFIFRIENKRLLSLWGRSWENWSLGLVISKTENLEQV